MVTNIHGLTLTEYSNLLFASGCIDNIGTFVRMSRTIVSLISFLPNSVAIFPRV